MDDNTISRQAAIEAVNNAFDRETLLTGFVRSIAVRAIRDMPSAQPEGAEKDIRAMCGECDAWNIYKNYPQNYSNSRCFPVVEGLPSEQPERKKGEWIPEFDGKFTGGTYWFSCSKCKRIVPEVRNGGWNFCPNCGSYNGGK